MNNTITDRIFEVLHQKSITNTELARILGVQKTNISEWKIGKSNPSPRLILKFLFHFPDIDANWLIHGKVKSNGGQTATGNYNVQAGGSATINESSTLQLENAHLKEILKEKQEQIILLKKFIDK